MRHFYKLILIMLFIILFSGNIFAENILPYMNPELRIEERVEDLISRMTLGEKIGQMVQAERRWVSPDDVKNFHLGSVLSGGGSAPFPNTPESWQKMYNSYQRAALETRLGIPIIYGVDSVHGHNNLYGATIFPHNIGLGATRDPDLVEKIGQATALETAATGPDWTFAPCVAVVRDERWGRTYESFGETPELQYLLSGAYVRGLQGPDAQMAGEYIIATAKHFIGDGGTVWGTGDAGYLIDRGDVRVDEKTLREIHLPGYIEAIEAGVGTIMASFNSYQGTKMHAHKYLLTDLLKKELGFKGFVVSDWEGINEISGYDYYTKVVKAVNAGIDMFMEPVNWKRLIRTLHEAVEYGDVSEERINDAVKRILTIKMKAGIFEEPLADEDLLKRKVIGSQEHRELAREAVRKSLVLLKNEENLLPLDKGIDIYVGGSNADDLGSQCGGWTITWQGKKGDITEGTTILEGVEQALAGEKGKVVTNLEEAEVAVLVIGEDPYAEGKGDDGDLELKDEDLQVISEAKEAGLPVVVIIVSGRPLIITEYYQDWDAIVAAWLPGSEGQGVADVIFGDYNFSGKLPVSWPKSVDQLPLNYGDENYDPLFENGYGLKMSL